MNHFGEIQKFGLKLISDRVKVMASTHKDVREHFQSDINKTLNL